MKCPFSLRFFLRINCTEILNYSLFSSPLFNHCKQRESSAYGKDLVLQTLRYVECHIPQHLLATNSAHNNDEGTAELMQCMEGNL